MRFLSRAIITFSLSLGLAILSACSHVFYQPSQKRFYDPTRFHLTYESVTFSTADGVKLHGWFFPAQQRQGKGTPRKGTVIQFHGNAENLSSHFVSLAWVAEAGYDFFTFDYRGYGQSEGKPSQAGLFQDALAAIAWVQERQPRSPIGPDLVLYGQSLGGAVLMRTVAALTDRSRIRAVVIDSSFYSYRAIARSKVEQSWVTALLQPLVFFLISDEYSPEPWISQISPTPLLVIHGTEDRIIPFEFGKEIYQLAQEPKSFWKIDQGHHIDSMYREQGKYREKLIEFLDQRGKSPFLVDSPR